MLAPNAHGLGQHASARDHPPPPEEKKNSVVAPLNRARSTPPSQRVPLQRIPSIPCTTPPNKSRAPRINQTSHPPFPLTATLLGFSLSLPLLSFQNAETRHTTFTVLPLLEPSGENNPAILALAVREHCHERLLPPRNEAPTTDETTGTATSEGIFEALTGDTIPIERGPPWRESGSTRRRTRRWTRSFCTRRSTALVRFGASVDAENYTGS